MKLEDLKSQVKHIQNLLKKSATPQSVLEKLKADFGDNVDAFPKEVKDAYEKYRTAYDDKLVTTAASLSAALESAKDAEGKNLPDESEIELTGEIADYGMDKFYRLQAQLERAHMSLQLIRSEQFRTQKNLPIISTDEKTHTERILFTNQDFSKSFLTQIQKDNQPIVTILNRPFNKQEMDKELKSINADKLRADRYEFVLMSLEEIKARNPQVGKIYIAPDSTEEGKFHYSVIDPEGNPHINETIEGEKLKEKWKDMGEEACAERYAAFSAALKENTLDALNPFLNNMLIATGEKGHTDPSQDGNRRGVSDQHRKDYTRGIYVFESDEEFPPLSEELETGDYVVDDLEKTVQAYLQRNELPQDAAPNVRALITTLLSQGAGVAGQLYMKFFTGFSHYGAQGEPLAFAFEQEADRGSVFFDSKTGKLHFETYTQRKYHMFDAQKVTPEQAEASKVFGKLSIEIDMKRDESGKPILTESGNPTFTVGDAGFELAVIRDRDFANAYPIRVNRKDFKNSSQPDEKSIDSLRACLNDMAKFAGYASLEEAFYERRSDESLEKAQFNAQTLARQAKFTPAFIDFELKTLDQKESEFFNKLYEDFYEKGKSADELSKDILSFAKQHLSEIPDTEKLRYVHLLRMGEQLSEAENKAAYKEKAINILTERYKEILGERNETIRTLYKELYEGEIRQNEVKTAITAIIPFIVKEGLKSLESDLKHKPFDEKRFAHMINLARNYSLPIPIPNQKIVELLCNREDSKQALFAFAGVSKNIYREIVEPRFTPAYFLRQIGELIGLVKPRPELTSQEHLALISQYPDLLNDRRANNPYRIKLNEAILGDNKLMASIEPSASQKKFPILSKYINDPSNYKGDIDKELCELANQLPDKSGHHIYHELNYLMKKSSVEAIKEIKSILPELFSQYEKAWPASPGSINYRLDMVVNNAGGGENYRNLDRFGKDFLDNLQKDLLALSKQSFDNPKFNQEEKQAIESIINTINTHENLYNFYIKKPEFKEFLGPLAAVGEKSKDDMRAKKIDSEVENNDKKLKESVSGADNQINLINKEVENKIAKESSKTPESRPSPSSSSPPSSPR